MIWVSDDDLECWQSMVSRGEALDVDECRHLLAEVRRLRRQAADMALLKQQIASAWEHERVALQERNLARDAANVLSERLEFYEERLRTSGKHKSCP